MTWILVAVAVVGQPAMIFQAQGYVTEKICKEARDNLIEQFDADTKKKIKPVCLMAPLTVAH